MALALAFQPAWGQTTDPQTQLPPVLVLGRSSPVVSAAGWGDVPLSLAPLQAGVFGAEQLKDRGVQRLSEITGFDAAVSDAYNTEGYWDYLTVRGFVIDNRFNYRRDGLPINAETSIALDNKAQIEVLKGTGGLQAGTSAPGGLVNYVVKRPLDHALRRASLEWREAGSVTASVDLSQRFGAADAFGLRVNAAAAHLDPKVHDAQGQRRLLAVAAEWRVSSDTLIEAEFETSRRSQPSVPGFSLLGDSVPAPVDARINLNNQSWSLPVVLAGDTASLRWTKKLADGWRFTAHGMTQRLRSDDRIAFPFGFDCNETSNFTGVFYCDRFSPDGRVDIYDFRSENERRRTDALDLSLQGRLRTGTAEHALTAGVLHSRVKNRFQDQTFAFSGVGKVDGSVRNLPASPAPNDANTNRDEHSTELSLRDAIAFDERSTLWLGVRHTRLHRQSVRTDPLDPRPTDYRQSFTTPFVAASHAFAPRQLVYASWSRGVESEVVPNRSRYVNAGQSLPALKSRQSEVGIKGGNSQAEWTAALFDIRRPLFTDLGTCDVDGSCRRQAEGEQRHRGVEGNVAVHLDDWTLRAGAQWLRARIVGVSATTLEGKQPTNVPARVLKLQADYRVTGLTGLSLQAAMVAESSRMALPDNSARIPGYAKGEVGARYELRLGRINLVWRAGIDNVTGRRAWRESPYQFSHAYLFPLAPRSLRLSLQAHL
jgi:iron complex outermembrane recepter protein